jgi:hypothetical protein
VLLPLLNVLTTGQHLLAYLAQRDIERAAVELTAIAIGALLAAAALRVRSADPRKMASATAMRKAAS